MADEEQLSILLRGSYAWNAWRQQAADITVDLRRATLSGASLSGANLSDANIFEVDLLGANLRSANLNRANLGGAILGGADLSRADLTGTYLSGANLNRANLRGGNLTKAVLIEANLNGANLTEANLRSAEAIGANLSGANLTEANLTEVNLSRASLNQANLSHAYLIGADLREANLTKATLYMAHVMGADLSGVIFNDADLSDADLTGCRVYGVSAWGLRLNANTKQQGLIITPERAPEITTEDIEVAQFIYLLLHNEKLRKVIDTITSKVVLILGRFSEERKVVLDAVRDALRKRNLLPIIFDFEPAPSRDVTETVKVLAGLARFVIADITDATEVRRELDNIVPQFTSRAIQPILLRGQREFVGMVHLGKFPWVLPSFEYDTAEHLLANLDGCVVAPAEAKVHELRRPQP